MNADAMPLNPESFRDEVDIYAKRSTQGPEAGREENLILKGRLRCSVQPVVGDQRRSTASGQIAADADLRAVFMEDPQDSGLSTNSVVRQVRRNGIALKRPISFTVTGGIQNSGGPGLTWTVYLKFTGP